MIADRISPRETWQNTQPFIALPVRADAVSWYAQRSRPDGPPWRGHGQAERRLCPGVDRPLCGIELLSLGWLTGREDRSAQLGRGPKTLVIGRQRTIGS